MSADEFCDRCRASVPTYRRRRVTFCDYCNDPLFDENDEEIIDPARWKAEREAAR